MLAFKFPDPYAGPLKPGATPFPFPNQLEESFQYAPVFDDSDDEYATSLALPEKLRSFQYAPVFDSDDEYAASLAPPAQLESFQHAPFFDDSDAECTAPLPLPARLETLQYASVFDSDDDCAAPPLPLPDQAESMKYAPAFDSDDEYVTDDGALSICSSLASEFSFRRRPIPVATKTPVSLIALELDAIRKDNIGFEDGEWEDSDWDNHSDGDYAPLKEANLAAGIVFDEELAQAVGRPPIASKPIENQAPDGHQATEVAHNDIATCAQPTHKTGLVVFANKAITNLKWCGGNITRLCTKTKGKQHTTPAPAARNQEAQAEKANEEEEVNPYDMFFGSGQHQSMRV
jgi:hypothetical protein